MKGRPRLAGSTPLVAYLALPSATGAVVAALYGHALLVLGVTVAANLLVGLELAHQVRSRRNSRRVWSAELAVAARRREILERRVSVLERFDAVATTPAGFDTARTFSLFSQLVHAEEATRAHIAAELHDAVAQTLSQALMELRTGRDAQAAESLEDAEEQLRAVMARIRPPELATGTLARAVADLCLDLERRYAVELQVSWPSSSIALPAALATTLYRFVQETLLNAVVHADGAGVRLDVSVEGGTLAVCVSDEGPGFDPAAVVSAGGRHVGLKLARERARLAGGSVEVQSAPGAGARLTLRLPVESSAVVLPMPLHREAG